jgi:hypothetical protein
VKFQNGPAPAGDDAFTFGDLAAQQDTLMKTCPISEGAPRARQMPKRR